MRWLLLLLVLGGCIGAEKVTTKEEITPEALAVGACIKLCKVRLEAGMDLSNGPCLSNEIIEDWVCDVAHSPRLDVDNLPENQCPAFREGKAHHFVELDEECRLIKTW